MTNKKNWLVLLVMVLVFGMAVIGCDSDPDNGNKGFTEAEKAELKDMLLEWYEEDPEEFAEFLDDINENFDTNFSGDPGDWSNSQWESFFKVAYEYLEGGGGGEPKTACGGTGETDECDCPPGCGADMCECGDNDGSTPCEK